MSEHTPGPWHVNGIEIRPDAAHMIPCGDDSYPSICTVWDMWRPDQKGTVGRIAGDPAANARLIAAAPDLLAALRLLHDNQAEYLHINQLGGYDNHDMQMARAALAKAEGGLAIRGTATLDLAVYCARPDGSGTIHNRDESCDVCEAKTEASR